MMVLQRINSLESEDSLMTPKRTIQLVLSIVILVSSFASAGSALAWGCASYITVQWGDTLSGIASLCGTTQDAIRAANPGLGTWVYAGQVLYIPMGSSPAPYVPPAPYGGNYTVQWGETLGIIASRIGVSVNDILAINPQITNASLVYAGQVISLPAAAPVYYTVCAGDTMRIIAGKYGTSVYSLQLLNPNIYDINLIYPGQVIRVW
jgi:LysM repeat protein